MAGQEQHIHISIQSLQCNNLHLAMACRVTCHHAAELALTLAGQHTEGKVAEDNNLAHLQGDCVTTQSVTVCQSQCVCHHSLSVTTVCLSKCVCHHIASVTPVCLSPQCVCHTVTVTPVCLSPQWVCHHSESVTVFLSLITQCINSNLQINQHGTLASR